MLEKHRHVKDLQGSDFSCLPADKNTFGNASPLHYINGVKYVPSVMYE
jgi:hypothetical protein